MEYLQFEFKNVPEELTEILEAELGMVEGFEGMNYEYDGINACYQSKDFDENTIKAIADQYQLTYTVTPVAQQNWNAVWESSFEPIVIDDFCYIRADFHEKPTTSFQHEIIITPKMSFGTGHHATTQQVMRMMRNIDFTGKSVFDFGTGTGILAILAAQLGATTVFANDVDEWCVENTIENCERNAISNVTVTLDSIEVLPMQATYDVILANINRHILLAYMHDMYTLTNDGGTLILSGILTEDIAMVNQAAVTAGFTQTNISNLNNWVAIQYIK